MATNPRTVFPGTKPAYTSTPPLAHPQFASNLTSTKPSQPAARQLDPPDRQGPTDNYRRLPSNLEAERAVLGAVLLDNACLASLTTAAPEHFFLHQHQIIARTMKAMGDENIPIDLVTLMEALERAAQLEAAGGIAYISQLADGLPRSSNTEHYARIVREKSDLRAVAYGAQAIEQAALDPEANPVELAARLQNLADGVTRSPQQRLKCVTAQEMLELELPQREMLLAPVLPTQGLAMLYSKRGLGKTYMSLSIAYAVASGDEFLGWQAPRPRPVLFVDGELPAATLKDRLAAVTQGMSRTAKPGMLRLITPDLQAGAFPDLATREGQALVENALGDAEFVILDNLSALCVSGKENEGESWLPVQRWALRLRQRGVSVLFVHHAGKGGAQRGTSRREDLLDVVINLRHPADYNPAEGLRCEVHYEKCRGFYGQDAKPFEVKMETGINGAAIWTKRDLEDVVEVNAAEMFEGGATVRQVAQELGISPAKAGRIRKRRNRYEGPDVCCNTHGSTPEHDSEDRDA
jgi:hypothetical protein